MRQLSFSRFSSAMDNQPKMEQRSWAELCRFLEQDFKPGAHPPGADQKRYLPAISGAAFKAGTTRSTTNVASIQLAIPDFDNAAEAITGLHYASGRPIAEKRLIENPATLADVCEELERRGIAAYAWNTWSSTSTWPRFRVVLPLASPVRPGDWSDFTEWVLSVTGLERWRTAIDLPVLRDTARLHFLPARRPGGPLLERKRVFGSLLDPAHWYNGARADQQASLLASAKVEGRAERNTHRFHSGQNPRYPWAKRFRSSDGTPLDLKTLDAIRLLQSLGCRMGSAHAQGRTLRYRTTCPWPTEHSHGIDDDSGMLLLEPDRWPYWRCSHSHHLHLGLGDLLEAAGLLDGGRG